MSGDSVPDRRQLRGLEAPARTTVRTLGPDDVPAVVDVLVEAFFDYPVMRFVLSRDVDDYERRLRTLVHFFVMARVFRHERLLGIGDARAHTAAALVSRPADTPSPPGLSQLREKVWEVLGPDARSRYEACGAAWAPLQVDVPHLHLNMIGVRNHARGLGLGRRLLDEVHRLSERDPTSKGVTLTTEDEANVAFYRHFGYEVVGTAEVAPELTTWGFFRANP